MPPSLWDNECAGIAAKQLDEQRAAAEKSLLGDRDTLVVRRGERIACVPICVGVTIP